MNIGEIFSLLASLAVFLYLFFRNVHEETAQSNTPQKRVRVRDEQDELRRAIYRALEIEEEEDERKEQAIRTHQALEQVRKKKERPKQKPAALTQTMPSKPAFPETASETFNHQLGNPWARDAYRDKRSQTARKALNLLKQRETLREAVILAEVLNKPRVTSPYTEWHIDR